jgi:hypothetical protein
MSSKYDVDELRKEIRELRDTVSNLRKTVGELTSHLEKENSGQMTSLQDRAYTVLPDQETYIEGDISWNRLVALLIDADQGLTATEAASKWGRSRSRTSEVLNKLADEGHVEKYRDGRLIRFRKSRR